MSSRRKRAREDGISDSLRHASKRRHSQLGQPSLLTPAPTARASSEPQSTWFLKNWLESHSRLIQEEADILTIEKAEGCEFLTIDRPSSPQSIVSDSQAGSDRMSQAVEKARVSGSVASGQSERNNTSSPMYRATLKMNGVIIDNTGTKIPHAVQELVTKHIRKERKSPRLGEEEKARIIQLIEDVWDSSEPMVSDIITSPLFPLNAPGIAQGRDTLWSTTPLPRSPDYPYALLAPKTYRHFGFRTSLKSDWTREELAAADHPKVRPYSQPTCENLFPSFLVEVKSEATGGTLYAAEGQLATTGAHRVSSLMWMLDQVDPSRNRSSADTLVFSAAVSQRQVVAHVHYYNPKDAMYYMSYIDNFHCAKDIQECHDHVKNVVDWLLEIQQPIVRDVLSGLHPITKLWKKGRSASATADAAESSIASEDGRPPKSLRTS